MILQYTPEQVSEIVKCQQDIVYFLSNYVHIISLDEGKVLFKPYEFQKEMLKIFQEEKFTCATLGRQLGKCVGKDINIHVRNKKTGDEYDVPIGEFYKQRRIERDLSKSKGYFKLSIDIELKNDDQSILSDTVNRKFVDSIDLDDWEIDTPNGFQPLTKIHKTIPYELWFLKTDQGLTLECADNHIVYDKNNQEIFVKDCIPYQTMIKTRNGLQRVIECINLIKYENMYDPEVDSEDHTYWSNDILSHNTITVCAFLLYQSIFNKDYFIAILANNASKSREILSRVKLMYELLPWWLKPGVVEWNKGSVEFSNGSKIFAGPTTNSSIRGYSINCLYCLSGESVITIKEDDHIKDVTINELMGLIEDDQDIFLDNKYSRVYWNLINKAKTRILEDHVKIEKHHIFPISIFGKNNNLVSLTLREHFFAHKLLVKMTKGKNKAKMVIAAFKMAHNMKKFLMMPSCKYETLKKEFSSIMKEKMTGMKRKNLHNKDPEKIRKTAEKHRGMKRTEETKKIQSESKHKFIEKNGSFYVGKGMIYVHHKETGQIKRVSKDFKLGNDWLPGNGLKRVKGRIWIFNVETKQRKKVLKDFIFELPWIKGWGPRK